MTNGTSFGGRNALLPVIFLLATYVFLQILHIKLPFWIWIVLLIVIFFISLLLSMRSKLSLTSHLPFSKTAFWILLAIVAAVIVILVIIPLFQSSERQETSFEDGGSIELDEFGAECICGTVIFKNINKTTKHIDYSMSISGLRKGESVKFIFTLEDEIQEIKIPFTAYSSSGGTVVVSFGLINPVLCESKDKGLVRISVGGVYLETGNKHFIANGQEYNATIRIETGRDCISCQKIGPGNFERADLIKQGRIVIIRKDFQ